jgi:hypothetical protein
VLGGRGDDAFYGSKWYDGLGSRILGAEACTKGEWNGYLSSLQPYLQFLSFDGVDSHIDARLKYRIDCTFAKLYPPHIFSLCCVFSPVPAINIHLGAKYAKSSCLWPNGTCLKPK